MRNQEAYTVSLPRLVYGDIMIYILLHVNLGMRCDVMKIFSRVRGGYASGTQTKFTITIQRYTLYPGQLNRLFCYANHVHYWFIHID